MYVAIWPIWLEIALVLLVYLSIWPIGLEIALNFVSVRVNLVDLA